MRVKGNCVYVSAREVAAFNAAWPCSPIRERSHFFEFAGNGDLVNTSIREDEDGGAATALAQDAQAYLRARNKMTRHNTAAERDRLRAALVCAAEYLGDDATDDSTEAKVTRAVVRAALAGTTAPEPVNAELLAALKGAEADQMGYVDRLRKQPRMSVSFAEATKRLEATRAAIAKAEGRRSHE